MPRLDLLHAALTGFRLTRSRPLMVVVFAAIFLVAGLVNMAVLAAYAGPQFTALMKAIAEGGTMESTLPQVQALYPHLVAPALICFPFNLVCITLILSAIWRAVLAPEQGGPGFLRLGIDEARQLVVLVLIVAFFTLAWVVSVIVIGMTSALIGTASQEAGALSFIILSCADLALCMMIGVHLSLAGPATFGRRKVQVLSAWNLANGRLWPILAVYGLALILSLVIGVLGWNIKSAPLVLAGGGYEALAKRAYTLSLAELISPLSLVAAALGAVFQALQILILVSPAADLYRQISSGEAKDAF